MEILALESVDSTNKYAKEHIDNLSDLTVVVASKQTDGRGRLDRRWSDVGEDNIYATIILKPSGMYKEVYSNLTQYLALVIAKTMEENYGIKPLIKWPNDVLVNGKKISGILAEGIVVNNSIKGIVLGFGINLNCSEDVLMSINQPATSLSIETGLFIDKNIFLKKLLDNFCLSYDNFIEDGFPHISDEYEKRFFLLDKPIAIKVYQKTVEGIAKGFTEKGALKIVDKNNREQILYVGDIL